MESAMSRSHAGVPAGRILMVKAGTMRIDWAKMIGMTPE